MLVPKNPPHAQPRVPKSNPKGPYIMFSNVIHHAGPLNPPHAQPRVPKC